MNYIEPEMVVISFRKANIITASTLLGTEIGGSGGAGNIKDDSVIDFGNGGFN